MKVGHCVSLTVVLLCGCKNTSMEDILRADDVVTLRSQLASGLNIESHNKLRISILHTAAARGANKCIRELVKSGAAIDSQDLSGCTPLDYAIINSHEGTANLLMELGADARTVTAKGSSPAELARAQGFEILAKRLEAAALKGQ